MPRTKSFSFREMPIVNIRRDRSLTEMNASEKLQDKMFIVRALLECFENNDPEGVIEILDSHFAAINKSEFSEKIDLPRRTLYDVLHGSKNPTLKVLVKCIQELLDS